MGSTGIGDHRRSAGLAALMALSEAGYVAILRLDAVNGARPVVMFLALMAGLFACYGAAFVLVRGSGERRLLLLIAAGALMFRLTLLPAGLPHGAGRKGIISAVVSDVRSQAVTYERSLIFDDDIWRYIWDGHIWAHGINPYRYAPADAALDRLAEGDLWSDVRDNINHPEIPTIYPPLAEAIFRLSYWMAPGSVLAVKALLTGFDLLAAVLVALTLHQLGRPPAHAMLYAWNPLVIKVFAGSGHVDAIVAATLAACAYFFVRQKRTMASLSFALAVLAKIAPIVVLPLVAKRAGWRNSLLAGAAVVAGYIPFLDAGPGVFAGFRKFAREWQFNAGPFAAMRSVAGWLTASPELSARIISGLSIAALTAWIVWRDDAQEKTFSHHAAPLVGFAMILSPVVMPWYIAGVLPLAAVAGQRFWFWFSAIVCCAFLIMIDGTVHAWELWLEYGTLAFLLGTRFCNPNRLGGRIL